MNKRNVFVVCALVVVSAALISWGATGHRAIGKIAENHLSPKAKSAVQDLLGTQSLADVATWADEVRNQEEYKHTGPWHYINLPLGLSYEEFQAKVKGMTQENVYNAIQKQEEILGDKHTTRQAKIEALKFIVHFVGDLHQPMHVSREEDKGGNTIQLNYEGKGTNLHSVWDSKLIEHQGLNYEQLAEKYDHLSAAQIKEWQADPLVKWMWESYAVSSRLYAEVDAMKTRSIDDTYYQAHLPIIQERIGRAGIRLAGLLNEVFKNGLAASTEGGSSFGNGKVSGEAAGNGGAAQAGSGGAGQGGGQTPVTIDIHDAAKHVDELVTICSKVAGFKALESMTLVNVGAAYPDQLLTVVLRGEAKGMAESIDGKMICVTGKIIIYKDKPEIIVTDPKQLVTK